MSKTVKEILYNKPNRIKIMRYTNGNNYFYLQSLALPSGKGRPTIKKYNDKQMNTIHLKNTPSLFFRFLSIFSIVFLLYLPSSAQENIIQQDPHQLLKEANHLYKKGLFADAQPLYEKYIHHYSTRNQVPNNQLNSENANFHYLVCAINLDQPHAISHAEKYIKNAISLSNKQKMSFELGHYYFKKKNYRKAVSYFEQTGVNNFSNEEIAKKKFEQGYAYFNLQEFDKALPLFNAVKNIHNKYYVQANYYTGYISLIQKKYSNALRSFKKIAKEPKYKKVVPYYIAEIYYYQDKYDQLLSYAAPYLEKGNLYYNEQLKHLVGQTYFEQKEYKKALPYLKEYEQQAKTLKKEDVYELAYSYYKTGQLEQAIAGFKQLSGGTDSLAQNSMYILGDCYLKTGQKSEARQAFAFGARSSYNPKQQEISKFNYGKLSFELGYQDAALKTLKAFIKDYPQSEYNQESREILAQLFANTADYKDALSVINNLPKNEKSIQKAYQRITFGRAMQLINDGQMEKANQLLDQSLQYNIDHKYVALSHFWKGEIALRQKQYTQAVPHLKKYLSTENDTHPALGEANIQTAHYNLGYSYLEKGLYQKAIPELQKAQHVFGTKGQSIANDAQLREADAYYMLKDYSKANELYSQVAKAGGAGSDYALYQRGIIAGIAGNSQQKLHLLSQVSSNHPQSNYNQEANYQMGLTYLDEGKYREAISSFKKVVGNKGNPNIPKASLKLAQAYSQMGNNNQAIKQYKELIQDYPSTTQAQEAMVSLKNSYINEGNPQGYFTYLKSIGRSLDASEEDSLTYATAESSFANENYGKAIQQFTTYLSQYPQGYFKTKAHYYRGESAFKEKKYDQALTDYEYVIQEQANMFLEHSAYQAADINFNKKKDYAAALNDYQQLKTSATNKKNNLTALRGILRSYYELQKWDQVESAAHALLGLDDLSTGDQIVSHFYLGRAAQEQEDCNTAISEFQKVAELTSSELGAASRYYIAVCTFRENQLSEAEKAAFSVIKKTPSYDLWVAKAYVLLGKIFWKEKDYFNAKATLQSIIDHSDMEEIVNEAKSLLEKVKADEQAHSKIKDSSSTPNN